MSTQSSNATTSEARIYWIHAVTPLHVGAGRGIGFVDLPITREVVTNWPFVPGSAVKGVLADHHGADADGRDPDKQKHDNPADLEKAQNAARLRKVAFGTGGDESANSGSLVFTDAHLVCLPVRSLYGTFAWCTSPLALERLARDFFHSKMGATLPQVSLPLEGTGAMRIHVTSNPVSALLQPTADNTKTKQVFFEDLDFEATVCGNADRWADALALALFPTQNDEPWRKLFCERFAVVPDDVFSFLCEMATQIDARVKINENTKTVAEGQLWYEESLPLESILAGIAWCGPVFANGARRDDPNTRAEIIKTFCEDSVDVQIGGKATVGRGRVRMLYSSSITNVEKTGVPS